MILAPYRVVAVIAVLIGALAAACYSGWTLRDWKAAKEAQQFEQAKIEALTSLNTRILQIQKDNVRAEDDHQVALAKASSAYQDKLKEYDREKNRVIAGIRAGSVRLRDPGREPAVRSGGSIDAETIASAAGRDGSAGGELSPAAAEFLWDEADRADRVVEQLAACQAVVVEDRKLCGAH